MTSPFGDLIQFASRNRGEGVLVEPRFYFDFLDFSQVDSAAPPYSRTVSNTDQASFTNGEQFPVRLTHVIIAPEHRPTASEGENVVVYERPSTVQQLFLRIERYGEYYMNEQFVRASAWHNVQSAQPYNLSAGSVVHRFFQPLVLSARDSLRVDFEALFPGATPMAQPVPDFQPWTINRNDQSQPVQPQIDVQVAGVGMRSGRPYLLAGPARPTTESGQSLFTVDPALLQNVGNESIALTEMTVTANVTFTQPGLEADISGLLSDARLFRMQVRQQGNGTQASWFRGPIFPNEVRRMPLGLFGTHLGSAVVHRFPGDGITLDPGEVVRVSGQNSVYGNVDFSPISPNYPNRYAVGMAGYLMVT